MASRASMVAQPDGWYTTPVNSSWIEGIGFNTKTHEMAMKTQKSPTVYTWDHKSPATFKEWLAQRSKGKFFNRELKVS